MLRFTLTQWGGDTVEYGIKFWYTGKTKGNPPKITNVALVKIKSVPFISANYEDAYENTILYCAKAVLSDGHAIVVTEQEVKKYQRDIKRVIHLKTPDRFSVVIFKGDNFCYKTGRMVAFKKLLKLIDDPDIRSIASQTYFDWEYSIEQNRKLHAAIKMVKDAGYTVNKIDMEEPF